MKSYELQGGDEKLVLSGMIVSSKVLEAIHQAHGKNLDGPFKSRWTNLVSRWCMDWWAKYQKAPGRNIQKVWEEKMEEVDEKEQQLIGSFLESLSNDSSKQDLNEDYVLARAWKHFSKVRLEKCKDEMEMALERNDIHKAEQIRSEAAPSDAPNSNVWINFLTKSAVREVTEDVEQDKSLVKFRGDLGRFLSPSFVRGNFISFAAPEKRGKSFWLQEVIWTALKQNRRVLYFVLGDMSKRQTMKRFISRMTLKPRRKQDGPVKIPRSIKVIPPDAKKEEKYPTAKIVVEERNLKPVTYLEGAKAVKTLLANSARKQPPLRVRVEGAGVVSASSVEIDVRMCIREGYIPDLVVIDYADLLLEEPGTSKKDLRDQIDASWKILKRIALDNNLIMLTATQAAARSYDKWLIKRKDFSDDKRKNAHSDGIIGINQTPEEKEMGVYRLNWPNIREGSWGENQVVWTAGNLAVGCPCLVSLLA